MQLYMYRDSKLSFRYVILMTSPYCKFISPILAYFFYFKKQFNVFAPSERCPLCETPSCTPGTRRSYMSWRNMGAWISSYLFHAFMSRFTELIWALCSVYAYCESYEEWLLIFKVGGSEKRKSKSSGTGMRKRKV